MKSSINSESSFEVWINNDIDSMADEIGSFDDNWIVSASDLFNGLELPNDDSPRHYDEVA